MSGDVSIDPVLAEQTKLTATLLNTIAAGCVVAGIITPLVGMAIGALQVTFDLRLAIVFCALLYVSDPTLDRQADPEEAQLMTLNDVLLLGLSVGGALAFAAWAYWLSGHKT